MAEEIVQTTRPAPFIEAAAQPYITDLTKAVGGFKDADLSQIYGPQFIAGLSNLQQQALGSASGLGSYQPYLQTAAGLAGPTAYQQFMSPYQQDVINTTLAEYDIQAQKGMRGIADQALAAGAFGGGREGVQRAELQRGTLATLGQAQQQGFNTALQAAQNQQQLAAQTGLQGGQLLGQLGTTQQQMAQGDINQLMAAGGLQRQLAQQTVDAARQSTLQQQYEPYQRLEFLKNIYAAGPTSQSGITSATAPTTNPLAQSIGTGLGAFAAYQGVTGKA